jgi:DNA-binding response OmpR family regulator
MYKIFIVEDDPTIAHVVKKHLESWGYEVKIAEDFRNISAEAAEFSPHLTLMDIGLPFHNGFYWCGEIRKTSNAPIVFLSSASDNMNIVLAMNFGGDDFIAKPFDLSVLTAKIGAVLRRSYDIYPQSDILEHKGVKLNLSEAALYFEGEKTELTKNEYLIIFTLMENKGKIVSRKQLMNKLWETDSYIDENTLAVNLSRLRKKLEKRGIVGLISTKAGMGYIME